MLNEPKVTLTKRYLDPIGRPLPPVARFAATWNRDAPGVAIQFSRKRNRNVSVSIPESVVKDAKERGRGAQLVFLFDTDTGTVYEYDISTFREQPYDAEHGEEVWRAKRGLRDAKFRWLNLGSDFYTNKNFWHP